MSQEHETSPRVQPPGTLAVGMCFRDWASFKHAVDTYALANNIVYTTQRSGSIARHNRILVTNGKEPLSDKFKFSHITLACKHNGRLRTRSRNVRPNQNSYKTGCPALVTVCVDPRIKRLVIRQFVAQHNHELGPDAARTYPERRRLSRAETKLLREQLMDETMKPAVLQEYVRMATSKVITCKDIYNIRSRVKALDDSHEGLLSEDDEMAPSSPEFLEQHVECGEEEYLEQQEDEHYDDAEPAGDSWSRVNNEVEIKHEEIALDEDIERVNDAWRCIYNMLEVENKRLKADNARLAQEVKQLKQKQAVCGGCNSRTKTSPAKPAQLVILPWKPATPRPGQMWREGSLIKVFTTEGLTVQVQAKEARIITPARAVPAVYQTQRKIVTLSPATPQRNIAQHRAKPSSAAKTRGVTFNVEQQLVEDIPDVETPAIPDVQTLAIPDMPTLDTPDVRSRDMPDVASDDDETEWQPPCKKLGERSHEETAVAVQAIECEVTCDFDAEETAT